MRFAGLSLLLLCGLSAADASALSQEEYGAARAALEDQAWKLSTLSTKSCPQEHRRLNKRSELRVSFFYGYQNVEDDLSIDPAHAAALVHVLKSPCRKNVEVCEFREVSRTENSTTLRKRVGARNVTLTVYHSSVSENGADNGGCLSREQDRRSRSVRESFHGELVDSDVVFYSGHSRLGSGLGFDRPSLFPDVTNFLLRSPLRDMDDALRDPRSRLKVLGIFACESERHYRAAVEDAKPDLNLILSKDNVEADEAEQQSLGALNTLLMNKCNGDLQRSLVSTAAPKHRPLEYVRRPE